VIARSAAKIQLKQDALSCSTVLRSSPFQHKLDQEGEIEDGLGGDEKQGAQNKIRGRREREREREIWHRAQT
jgi:hypothetical protein